MSPASRDTATRFIKDKASELGFTHCGISQARFLEEDASRLEEWLKRDYNGSMSWMNNHFEKRLDPTKLVPGAKSVVSLLLNYHTELEQTDPEAPKISKYAYGRDYHKVIKKKLKTFMNAIHETIGQVEGRAFVDSAPVMDKSWARESGLGWVGKHSNLINKEHGSWFFVCELIIDLELNYDQPFKTDHCGSCTRCIDACPTEAIVEPYVVDGSRCISYLTIELKDEVPNDFHDKMDGWAFGCDVCQTVCPWNRFSTPGQVEELRPNNELLDLTEGEWLEMTKEVFGEIFSGSAVKRTKFEGLKRNLKVFRKAKNKPSEEGS